MPRLWGRGDNTAPAPSPTCPPELQATLRNFANLFADVAVLGGPTAPPEWAEAKRQLRQQEQGVWSKGPLPAVERLVAFGDFHGDFHQAVAALRAAGVVGPGLSWTGGTATVVQMGDILDRGPYEVELLYLLERLQYEAARAGGHVHLMAGNHEAMGLMSDNRYVDPGAYLRWRRWAVIKAMGTRLATKCGVPDEPESRYLPPNDEETARLMNNSLVDKRFSVDEARRQAANPANRYRWAALLPGGYIATRFLEHTKLSLQIGGTAFAHGGILPRHLDAGLHAINQQWHTWVANPPSQNRVPQHVVSRTAVVWTRAYSEEDEASCDCATLEKVLGALGA